MNGLNGFDQQTEVDQKGICTFTDIRDSMPCGALAIVSFRKLVRGGDGFKPAGDSADTTTKSDRNQNQWYIHNVGRTSYQHGAPWNLLHHTRTLHTTPG